jgi:hypothetical protein
VACASSATGLETNNSARIENNGKALKRITAHSRKWECTSTAGLAFRTEPHAGAVRATCLRLVPSRFGGSTRKVYHAADGATHAESQGDVPAFFRA